MVTGSVTASAQTQTTHEIIDEAISKILLDDSVGCVNVIPVAVPPFTTWDIFMAHMRHIDSFEEQRLEGWFHDQAGFSHDNTRRGNATQYTQDHFVTITGLVWKNTFEESYRHLHDRTERIAWAIEKNKDLLGLTIIDEVNNVQVSFPPFSRFGEHFLHRVEISFTVLRTVTEAAGRVATV